MEQPNVPDDDVDEMDIEDEYDDDIDDDDCILWEGNDVDDDASRGGRDGGCVRERTSMTHDVDDIDDLEGRDVEGGGRGGETSTTEAYRRDERERMRRFYDNGFRLDGAGGDGGGRGRRNDGDDVDDVENDVDGGDNDDDDDDVAEEDGREPIDARGPSRTRRRRRRGRGKERIVGCIVGTHLQSNMMASPYSFGSDGCPSRDGTASLLIPDPISHPRMFYIMTLGTCREFRRCGLGSMLVGGIVDMIHGESGRGGDDRDGSNDDVEVEEAGKRKRWGRGLTGALYLHVIIYNTGAMRLYERLGFVRVKRIKGEEGEGGRDMACARKKSLCVWDGGGWRLSYRAGRMLSYPRAHIV